MAEVELTILMPCLNEEQTVVQCTQLAQQFLEESGVCGEVLVADNGSSDNSAVLAEKAGARVINVTDRGYGNALIGGIKAAYGKYVIMGDCDMSYDFLHLDGFVEKLRAGYPLVMGCHMDNIAPEQCRFPTDISACRCCRFWASCCFTLRYGIFTAEFADLTGKRRLRWGFPAAEWSSPPRLSGSSRYPVRLSRKFPLR